MAKSFEEFLIDVQDKVEKSKAKVERAQDTLFETSQKLFQKGLSLIFKTHDSLESFAWKQYTPSWNDGDPCTFSASTDYVFINNEEEEVSVYNLENKLEKLNTPNLPEQISKLQQELASETDKYKKERIEYDLKVLNLDVNELEKKLKLTKDLISFLSSFDNYFFERSFGEGKVVVTPNSINTEYCEHD